MNKKIKIYAEVLEDSALQQFNKAMSIDCNVQGALMPDAHTGYTLPIGSVIKSINTIFPSYVGYDIGCGMLAVNLDIHYSEVNLDKLKVEILRDIPIGTNRRPEPQIIPTAGIKVTDILIKNLKETGCYQLGTLGGGNHFIEVGKSAKDETIWIIIHSGSRGLGHKVASHYMNEAYLENNKDELLDRKIEIDFESRNETFKSKNPNGYKIALHKHIDNSRKKYLSKKHDVEGHFGFDINSKNGIDYINDMNFCLNYAFDNRKYMFYLISDAIERQVSKIVRSNYFINRNHNHAEIDGNFVVHRKGATHAEKDMLGVIPANMRDGSFIVKGKGNHDSICSSSHGAGRVLSRSKANKVLLLDDFHSDMKGILTNHNDKTIDESPRAYKNIFEVMELQKDLVEVMDRAIPLLNIKG